MATETIKYGKDDMKYALFDLDGTLTDPGLGITNSVMYALRKFGIEVSDRRILYRFIGPPLTDSFEEYYGFSKEDSLLALKYYREYFREKGIFENTPYEGVSEMLADLRSHGVRLAVATSKPEEFAVRILKHFELFDFFDLVAGATMDETRNRKEDIIRYALEISGAANEAQAVMVGDRLHDIEGAKKNGLLSIGVLYGYGSREELTSAGADMLAETPSDVAELIQKIDH